MTAAFAYSDFLRFFRSWVANPRRVAAVAPSSESLAQLITQEIRPCGRPIIELGAGTGVFTRALLARGVRESDLTLIEYGSDFMRILQQRFPQARVLWMDASQLANYGLFPSPTVDAVISGLPLLTMSPRKVMSILSGAFTYVRAQEASINSPTDRAAPCRVRSSTGWAEGDARRRNGPQHSSGSGLSDHPASCERPGAPSGCARLPGRMMNASVETVLVTGGTGFVAGWCIVELLHAATWFARRCAIRQSKRPSAPRSCPPAHAAIG